MPTNFSKVDRLVDEAIKAGLYSLGNDIKKRATILAPKDTGALRQSSRVTMSAGRNDSVAVSFNTPYARMRHYNNRKHPATRLYLTNAMKSINNVGKYFPKLF